MTAQERLIATAEKQVGYIGKKSNAQLDSAAANAGGKYNKFARDLDALKDFYNGPKNGYDWCDVFVDWCFVTTFGRELAQKLLCQPNRSCGAGTGYSLAYYKSNGRFFSTPQVGDQIFFGDSKSTWHTGIVTRVTAGLVYTVEGNAGSPLGVHAFSYPINSKTIKGYGRPNWALVPAAESAPTASAAGAQPAGVKVGDIVDFRGSTHYASSSAAKGSACKPGKAKVTAVAKNAAHPYHLVRESGGGSTVYGWVDAKDILR